MKLKMSEAKAQSLIPPQGSFMPPVPSGYYKVSVMPTGWASRVLWLTHNRNTGRGL